MKKREWTPRNRIENEYRKSIEELLARFFDLPDHLTLAEITQRLVEFAQYRSYLDKSASRIASRMATQIRADNARSWQEAAAQGSRGRLIHLEIRRELQGPVGARLDAIVRENAQLITSIPNDLVEHVTTEIAGWQQEGLRPEEIAVRLRKRVPELTRSRAKLIARTETSKAATGLTRARAEKLGLDWYVWATSEDERVRLSHRKMDQVLVAWDDPPAPEALIGERSTLGHYHAGNCPNCRCDSYPIVTLDDVSWPAKVYRQGSIKRMTRARFKQLLKLRALAA